MKRYNDLTGQRFGRLVVLRYAGTNRHRAALFECKCDCGNQGVYKGTSLKDGTTKSCGCFYRDTRKLIGKKNAGVLCPDGSMNIRHGDAKKGHKVRLYNIWAKMKGRCSNPNVDNYKFYGGRGIKVCQEWNTYEPFRDWALSHGYSDNLSIDRIDNDGDYSPENCRWISTKEQAFNKRNSIYLEHNGERKPLKQWCEEKGVSYKAAHARYKKGLPFEKIFREAG